MGETCDQESQVQRRGQVRLVKWSKDCKQELWADVMQRSRRQFEEAPAEHRQRDGKRLEAAVNLSAPYGRCSQGVAAFELSTNCSQDRRHLTAIEGLTSSRALCLSLCLRSPTQRTSLTSLTTVVRSALSTFGPGSAAGLFGIKPLLLQQATRAESYNFGSTLTRACNYFARGRGPEFSRPLMAGGVSIALEKSQTAVRPLSVWGPHSALGGKVFLSWRQGGDQQGV